MAEMYSSSLIPRRIFFVSRYLVSRSRFHPVDDKEPLSYSHLYIRLMDAPGSIGFFAADNSAARFPAPNE